MSKALKTAIVIPARMTGAVRGQPLLEAMGRPLLWYQIQRLNRVRLADELIVATTLSAGINLLLISAERIRYRIIAVTSTTRCRAAMRPR